MLEKQITISIKANINEALIKINDQRKFFTLFVVENDKIVEFISISDLVLAHLNEVEFENDALKGSVTGNVRRKSN